MIEDLRTFEDGREFSSDIVVIGAGAAGIVLAKSLAEQGASVALVESGGLDLELETQRLAVGGQSGQTYFPLDECRYRMFGGSTYRWGARSAPFPEFDMIDRDWLGIAGWPISRDSLQPYYDRVPGLLDLHTPFSYEPVDFTGFSVQPPDFDAHRLRMTGFQFGKNLLFGSVFRDEIARSEDIRVLLHANVTQLGATERADKVTHLDLRTLDGKSFKMRGGVVVLAAGGIENPRLLLMSNQVQKEGLANGSDCVGRYFMEHPTVSAGVVEAENPQKLHDVFSPGLVRGRLVETCLAPTAEEMREQGMLHINASTRINVAQDPTQALREIIWNVKHRKVPLSLSWYRENKWLAERLAAVTRDPFSIIGNLVRHARGKPKRFKIESMRLELRGEQAPNPDSRVTLANELDRFGQPRAHLHWALTELDWRSMRGMAQLIDKEFRRLGVGRVRLADWLTGAAPAWPSDLVGGHHHMGATRMAADPGQGVVDANLKAHGIDNLYVLGSSVFPTASYVNPTTTILALAMRLADHLREKTQ